MASEARTKENDPLEALRSLINSSIDIVQQDLAKHNDAKLDLTIPLRHPLRDRYDETTTRALKCLSSAGAMLRALCDPETWLHEMMFSSNDLSALLVACEANVANILGDGTLDSAAIAAATGIEADKISRCLRALCNMHIFREVKQDVYQNNEISSLLKSDARRALVGLCAEEQRLATCKLWEALTKPGFKGSSAVNKSAFNIAYDTDLDLFSWWKMVRPDLGERAVRALPGKGINYEQHSTLYPWADEPDGTLVVDVGGGAGGALLPIVVRAKNLRLQVQDLAETEVTFVKNLTENYAQVVESGRASFQAQDFFQENQTKGAPIYHLRHIIHDWPDSEATTILGNIAAVMAPGSKLLLCEHLVLPTYRGSHDVNQAQSLIAPEPLLPNWGASFTSKLDLQMMACFNSRQRGEADYEGLADKAGLRLARVWRNLGDMVILEFRRR